MSAAGRAYIDWAQYVALGGDEAAGREEFEELVGPACDVVDALCGGQIGDDLSGLREAVAAAVRRAVAAEVEYLRENGGRVAAINGAVAYGGRVSLGDFSYGDGRIRDREERILLDTRFNQLVLGLLLPTGLLDAGVGGMALG